jgi:hypothetical protein
VLRPVFLSSLLCCPLNSHISSLEASKHVLHSYSTPSTSATFEVVLWATHNAPSSGLIAHSACPDAATLCTMRTLQIRETRTILKVGFPVDARIRPFMPPTRKRDPGSLSYSRRQPLYTSNSPQEIRLPGS